MRVRVSFSGPLRVAVGSGEVDLALAGTSATLAQALAALCSAYPRAGRYLPDAPGTMAPGVRVLLNGARLDAGAASLAPLCDGDRLALLMPVVGG